MAARMRLNVDLRMLPDAYVPYLCFTAVKIEKTIFHPKLPRRASSELSFFD
jgi:hypothetical protein